MSYISLTDDDRKKMLAAVGISSIEELFHDIPDSIKINEIPGIPAPVSEIEISRIIDEIENRNCLYHDSFLGAGAYNHYIPAVVDEISSRSEFYTAYTPYQPEVSQGTLAAIFEFQTMMSRLTGMDLTNASMYDGATALAESVNMSIRANGLSDILVSSTINPLYRDVLETYAWSGGFNIITVGNSDGVTDPVQVKKMMTEKTGALVIQSPNFFGCIEDVSLYSEITGDSRINLIVTVTEALSLALLKAPGYCGADIVCGEAQSFGNYLNFGGPYAGYISAGSEFARKMPGRLVGKTVDSEGNPAFALTLQTREQHIRREKATSNICTNQGLVALRSAVYLSLMGNRLKEIAELNHGMMKYMEEKLKEKGIHKVFDKPCFNEFLIKIPDAGRAYDKLKNSGIIAGVKVKEYFQDIDESLLVCVTEMNSIESIDRYVSLLCDN
jgi:glycine dehydrogenase subunit 1